MAKSSSPPEWKPFTTDQYREAIFRLVHFSTKTINSNAKAVGIRLSTTDTRPLRYLCASSVLASGCPLPLDYLTNSGPAATIAKQVDQVLTGQLPDDADPDDVALIRALYRQASREPWVTGMGKVSPRVRQLFLPRDDGGYVAITPITSSGLTATVRERTQANLERWREAKDNDEGDPDHPVIRRLRTAYLGFGGDNAQNIGRLPNRGLVQYPLFFSAPRDNRSVREQYLAAYRGVWPLLNRTIMTELRDTLVPLLVREGGELPSNLRTRELVDRFIDRLMSSLLHRADHARHEAQKILVQETTAAKPDDATTDQPAEDEPIDLWRHLPRVQQGLLEPGLRDRAWRQALSSLLAQSIKDYRYPDETRQGRPGFDRAWLVRIENRIEEALP
ncbi:type I-F CRISPR-associated protein Csy1 [Modicisalibacter tunisiensis]|uniref:Uncharacterized protein n=1 Tax=Modicisalibacter tunisiensis TaxID=390637 RepID=A0ABS7WYS3_9GAMM|nr:type I-F CRISPR-associated protein Csy1 [Modicisalibacter tunisiensis]MBZ9539574.1 hypothetical protein [Modicisalibacter tunisiensis]MBZ9567021.1 hypothetical protein [Modicisalibacter tunisiensis]